MCNIDSGQRLHTWSCAGIRLMRQNIWEYTPHSYHINTLDCRKASDYTHRRAKCQRAEKRAPGHTAHTDSDSPTPCPFPVARAVRGLCRSAGQRGDPRQAEAGCCLCCGFCTSTAWSPGGWPAALFGPAVVGREEDTWKAKDIEMCFVF